jgi:RecB family endonuclease NucS
MSTCAKAIKDVFKSKDQILTAKQIVNEVQKKHPGKWKDVTIRTHTMGCSVNHTSSKWYPSFPKFLYTVGPGKVRLYDKEKDGDFTLETSYGEKPRLDGETPTEEDSLEVTLSLERDMQEYLSKSLDQLEPGLKLFTEEGLTGTEVSTEAGKIDILAKDAKGNLVVIELKANQASHSTIGQILSYMAAIKKEFSSKSVKGIIVAEDFDKKLSLAVTEVQNVSLVKYKVKFDFQRVP